MAMTFPKLRPCPWCGNAVDLTLMSLSGVRVTCDCCAAEGPVRKSATAAKKAWNERDGQSFNDQLWCLVEIRRLIGDPEAKLMQSELIDKVREMANHFRDATKKGKRREAAKGEK